VFKVFLTRTHQRAAGIHWEIKLLGADTGRKQVIIMTMRAQGADWYLCLGSNMPSGRSSAQAAAMSAPCQRIIRLVLSSTYIHICR
jgi:hypothetical protein